MADRDTSSGFPALVAERIEHSIHEGQYAPGSRLPSHRDLCEMHGVSLKTVRRALDILERRGLLYRRERSGTFVQDGIRRPRGVGGAAPLACITVVEPEQVPARAILRNDYFEGYAETLQGLDVTIRTRLWRDGGTEFESLLAEGVPMSQQGCILLNVAPPELMRWLGERGVPYVVQFFRYYVTEGLPAHHRVYVNKVRAGFEATQHLLDLGHQRVWFVGHLPEVNDFPDLYEGYRAALLCAGMDHGPNDIFRFFTDDVERAMDPMRELLRRPDRPGALFTQTDAMAFAILRAAKEQGVRVPEDLSVVGFNDLPMAARTDPPLTTVSSPRRALARAAVELLFAAGDAPPGRFYCRPLSCHMVYRKSTAIHSPAPARF